MGLRNIRLDTDPILRKKSRKVEIVDDKIKQLVEDMFETMYHSNGVGLAAVQVGVLKQVIVIDVSEIDEDNEKYVLINPEIVKESGEQIVDEGCLSFPHLFGKVRRPCKVTVRALDENGKKQEIKASGLLAQAISHEVDHLNGIVFIDKVEENSLWREE